jgi:transcriptional regulator with XRE-family HTH domain
MKVNLIEMGLRIRKQRELLGYTREKLAERLDVSPKFCSDIELGVKGMSIGTLVKLSQVLKLTTDYILLGNATNNNYDAIINMLNTCKPDKVKYAEEILKNYILALD